jgi:hypothetical protein
VSGGWGVLVLSDFEQAAIPTTTTAIINDIPKMYFFILNVLMFNMVTGTFTGWLLHCVAMFSIKTATGPKALINNHIISP